jgi:hypothetical protein
MFSGIRSDGQRDSPAPRRSRTRSPGSHATAPTAPHEAWWPKPPAPHVKLAADASNVEAQALIARIMMDYFHELAFPAAGDVVILAGLRPGAQKSSPRRSIALRTL